MFTRTERRRQFQMSRVRHWQFLQPFMPPSWPGWTGWGKRRRKLRKSRLLILSGLIVVFAGLLYFGPNVEHPRWSFLSFGSAIAVVAWLIVSAAFAIYTSKFGSYNKAWGSLSAVVVMLTWLWLSSLALLFGAEVNAEAERSRGLRRGERAEERLTASTRA